jgi:hypothetical protein
VVALKKRVEFYVRVGVGQWLPTWLGPRSFMLNASSILVSRMILFRYFYMVKKIFDLGEKPWAMP